MLSDKRRYVSMGFNRQVLMTRRKQNRRKQTRLNPIVASAIWTYQFKGFFEDFLNKGEVTYVDNSPAYYDRAAGHYVNVNSMLEIMAFMFELLNSRHKAGIDEMAIRQFRDVLNTDSVVDDRLAVRIERAYKKFVSMFIKLPIDEQKDIIQTIRIRRQAHGMPT